MKKNILLSLVAILLIYAALPAQTINLVKDINPSGFSNPRYFTGIRSGVFPTLQFDVLFSAAQSTDDFELWITDGTSAGTRMVKDINASGSSNPLHLTHSGNLFMGKVFFSADDGSHGTELWVTAGTEASTRMVADINPGLADSHPDYLTAYNGNLIFHAFTDTYGEELYITDGTEAGTRLLIDICPGSTGSRPEYLTAAEGKVWFSADDGTHGQELWVTDGTTENTQMILNINTHTSGGTGSYPKYFTSFNGKVYFSADDGDNGSQLYVTDGTTGGTRMVKLLGPSSKDATPHDLIVFADRLYFSAYIRDGNRLIYRTDGTEGGTELFPAIQEGETGNNKPLIVFNNRLFSWIDNSANGAELWSTDGTEGGTILVKDIRPGSADSDPGEDGIAVMNSLLYFTAINDDDGKQVWVTDGTTLGTRMIMPEIAPMEYPLAYTSEFYVWNEILYFTASYTNHSAELWKILPPATGLEDLSQAPPEYEFWPNPARGELNINCSHPVTLRIFDLSGRVLTEKPILRSGTISLVGLAPGLYFIADREHKTVRKLIVE